METSILGRAILNKKIAVRFYDLRDYLNNPRERVDGKPFGGGPGMVIRPEPVIKAILDAKGRKKNTKIIFFDRKGTRLTNKYANVISQNYRHVILVSGRYEGIDARAYEVFRSEDVERLSIGPYILTGGEIPSMAFIDCVSRQVGGVLGDSNSLEEGRVAGRSVYTRPQSFSCKNKDFKVPSVLISGHHAKIDKWKKRKG